MFIASLSDPESPISQSITGIIGKAFNEYMSQHNIPGIILDIFTNSPELNNHIK